MNAETFSQRARAYCNRTYPGFWHVMERNGVRVPEDPNSISPEVWVDGEWETYGDSLSSPEP